MSVVDIDAILFACFGIMAIAGFYLVRLWLQDRREARIHKDPFTKER